MRPDDRHREGHFRGFGPGAGPWAGGGEPPEEDRWGRRWAGPPFRGRRGRSRFTGESGSFFGPGPRAARGDIRAAILALLGEAPMHGYQIIKELEARTGGVWKPSPGSVYPTLQQLEDEGVVAGREQDGKRVFELTDAGRGELAALAASRPAPWDEVGSDVGREMFDLRDMAREVAIAVRMVAHAGRPEQVQAAGKVLADARRALFRILADDADGAGAGQAPPPGS